MGGFFILIGLGALLTGLVGILFSGKGWRRQAMGVAIVGLFLLQLVAVVPRLGGGDGARPANEEKTPAATAAASPTSPASPGAPVQPSPAAAAAAPLPEETVSPNPSPNCHPSYPDLCIPPPPPRFNCSTVNRIGFRVRHDVPDPDPHDLDPDRNGIGCDHG